MSYVTYITGGARSGKSRFAQSLAEQQKGRLLYVATAQAGDAEMEERVRRHRLERGDRWMTLEEPMALAERLPAAASGANAILLDCVTLWVSNLFFYHEEDEGKVQAEVERFLSFLPNVQVPVFIVSNEVGLGIVPENRLARIFRDLQGRVNQRIAGIADEAWLLVSGMPLKLK